MSAKRQCMKLFVSPMSPYVRKVRAVAIQAGLDDQIEVILCRVRVKTKGLEGLNPFGRVPTLVLDDGSALFDSPVICEYLDTLHGGRKLLPASGNERWKVLRQQALGDGIMDAAGPWREEGHRPREQQSSEWMQIYRQMIERGLDFLEREVQAFTDATIGTLSIGCALGYLDFRFAGNPWRDGRPGLAGWFRDFEKLEALRRTKPYQIKAEDL